ncbi:MAG: carboxypeptidase regulatory-like domain-containing protein [Nitrospira sp.]|nr:carboxypeptidase regulatory-like domain-containing protein [Nitrospira sp.]MDE0487287.1 carboxypeptidase regulatory-like domain-containing protein [Nitrospira sp.]
MWRRIRTMSWLSLVVWSGFAGAGFAYDVIDVRNGATITGKVALTGALPHAPRRFEVRNGPEVCGPERVLTKLDVHDGMVQGVVIALEGVEQGKPFASHRDAATDRGRGAFHYAGGNELNLDVRLEKCSFGPFTGVIRVDESVRFVNHDSIKHTLHTYSLKGRKAKIMRTLHTQSLRAQGQTEKNFPAKKLRRASAVVLTCDRHDFMENWLYMVRNPYYAISDESGNFEIGQIPPGNYKLVAWHPVLGMNEQRVTVTPDGRLAVNFEFIN